MKKGFCHYEMEPAYLEEGGRFDVAVGEEAGYILLRARQIVVRQALDGHQMAR